MIETARLILRGWRESDREPFYQINSDPQVMQFFPAPLSRAESDAMADRIEEQSARRSFSLYAVELRVSGGFIGFTGLSVPSFEAHFTPCVEIGWRLAAAHWNQGLATEGAAAVLRYAFEDLKLDEVVAFTAAINLASRRVMEKLGMTRDPAGDFDHPRLAGGHPLRRHVLYRALRVADEDARGED